MLAKFSTIAVSTIICLPTIYPSSTHASAFGANQEEDKKEVIYALAELEALTLRQLRPDERDELASSDETEENNDTEKNNEAEENNKDQWLDNSCGIALSTFSVTQATTNIPATIDLETAMDESCAPPFDFSLAHEDHFLIIQDDEVFAAEVVDWTLAGERVLLIEQDNLDYWQEIVGTLDKSLTISQLSSPVIVFEQDDPNDPDVRAYVEEDKNLSFYTDENGGEHIVWSKGVYLKDLFPPLEEEATQ